MPGTKEGGIKAAATNKNRHGGDFYSKIGREGGKMLNSRKGFGYNRQKASEAGRKGGTISRKRPKVTV